MLLLSVFNFNRYNAFLFFNYQAKYIETKIFEGSCSSHHSWVNCACKRGKYRQLAVCCIAWSSQVNTAIKCRMSNENDIQVIMRAIFISLLLHQISSWHFCTKSVFWWRRLFCVSSSQRLLSKIL